MCFLTSTQISLEFNNSISNNCREDNECPTWFTCVSNECLCGNQGSDAVVCDTHRQTSAVLDCHCVTYDKENQSTFAGLCFYNCENHHSKKKNDLVNETTKKSRNVTELFCL